MAEPNDSKQSAENLNAQGAADAGSTPAANQSSQADLKDSPKAAPDSDKQPGGSGQQLQVNAQIVDAVKQTRNAMRIEVGDTSKVVDSGIAYQKASQAAAFAVQDATDYLRNIMSISSTAQGMALKLLLETKDPSYATIIAQAQQAVTMAASNLETVGTSAVSVASTFPR